MERLRVTFLGPAASFSHQVRKLEIQIIESILMLVYSLTIESGSPRILWSFGGALAFLVICRRVLRRSE